MSLHNFAAITSTGKKNICDQNESFHFQIHRYSIYIKLIYISIYINKDFFYTASVLPR